MGGGRVGEVDRWMKVCDKAVSPRDGLVLVMNVNCCVALPRICFFLLK
jgi:hypothetical protein